MKLIFHHEIKCMNLNRKRCHRCVVIYEKHKNVLQYKESECEDMDHFNTPAMPSRSVIKSDHRGVAHPNIPNTNGHSQISSSSDQFLLRSNDDNKNDDCKQTVHSFSILYLFFPSATLKTVLRGKII